MELLRASKRRNHLSESVYILLNIALAVGVVILINAFERIEPAIILVLLSKWRVLAVRPQFWGANIVANAVDVIFSIGMVALIFMAEGAIVTQSVLATLWVAWLLILKPRSKPTAVTLQAGLSLFVGITALLSIAYNAPAFVVVFGFWLIGYTTARHVLTVYKEPHFALISMIWALVMAELGFLFYHWSFTYPLIGASGVNIAQASIVTLLIGLMVERAYVSYHRDGKIQINEIVFPAGLSIVAIGVLLTVFNSISIT